MNDPGHVDIFPASRMPRNVHHLLKHIYRVTSSGESLKTRDNMKQKGFRIITEPRTLHSVLQWTPDEEVSYISFMCLHSIKVKIVEQCLVNFARGHSLSVLA